MEQGGEALLERQSFVPIFLWLGRMGCSCKRGPAGMLSITAGTGAESSTGWQLCIFTV